MERIKMLKSVYMKVGGRGFPQTALKGEVVEVEKSVLSGISKKDYKLLTKKDVKKEEEKDIKDPKNKMVGSKGEKTK